MQCLYSTSLQIIRNIGENGMTSKTYCYTKKQTNKTQTTKKSKHNKLQDIVYSTLISTGIWETIILVDLDKGSKTAILGWRTSFGFYHL